MMTAYKEGKDLYATIASGVYKNDYWDNMETRPDGTSNPDGAARRSNCKSILLGIMYGRGVTSVAEQIGSSIKEAQNIIDDFFTSFPNIKEWVTTTQENAKKLGYVEDLWGRRRRLPDIQLPKYEARFRDDKLNVSSDFNPLLGSKGIVINEKPPILDTYLNKLYSAKSRKDIQRITLEAWNQGVAVKDNSGFISQAERQSVNARVQGGAATMSKKAMINVYRDPKLNELGFKLLLAVHDELIGECPEDNAEAVADRLCEVMKLSALPECEVPFKCDPTITKSWYEDQMIALLNKEKNKLIKEGKSAEEWFDMIVNNHPELTIDQITEMIN